MDQQDAHFNDRDQWGPDLRYLVNECIEAGEMMEGL